MYDEGLIHTLKMKSGLTCKFGLLAFVPFIIMYYDLKILKSMTREYQIICVTHL